MPEGRGAAPRLPTPSLRHLLTPAWSIHARSEKGPVRTTMQDAFAIIADAPCAWRRCDAVAVFDGVGGLRNGGEAAQAAVDGLRSAIAGASTPGGILSALQAPVEATGGATTAVVALLPRDGTEADLVWAGDSSAYGLDGGGGLQPLTAADAHGGVLTQCLGLDGMRPHEARFVLGPAGAVLLCSDGVDGVLGRLPLQPIVAGPGPEDRRHLDLLFAAVAKAGAPDNATVVLARRKTS